MDLLKQFQVNLSELLGAVAQGKALHDMQNIADSGAPFEKAFMDMLTRQLPPTYLVKNGYFYSPDSQVSNEIDIIISLARESFNLEMSQQKKPVLPFTSVITTIQLKNSYSQLNNAIEQSHSSFLKWKDMMATSMETNISPPISIVVCGCNNLGKDIDKLFIDNLINEDWLPDYILLLESGVIITRYTPLFSEQVSFQQSLRSGEYNGFTVCCTNQSEKSALALLWLYTAITSRLNQFASPELDDIYTILNDIGELLDNMGDANISLVGLVQNLKRNAKRHTIFSNAINRKYQLTPIL